MCRPLTDADLPGFWRDADSASLAGQRWTLRYSRLRLAGSLLAAVGSVFSLQAGRFDLAAAVIFAGFAVALTSELAAWAHQPETSWYDGRAMAESAKTLAWRYSVGAEPFPISMGSVDAERLLRERMSKVADQVSDRITMKTGDPVSTSQMVILRSLPFGKRRGTYVEGRTNEQQKWYANKADENRRHATCWRVTLVIAEVAALLLAALRFLGGWEVNLAGLMAATIAAGAAWVAVKQFSPLASAYSVAAKELAIQANRLVAVPENEWSTIAADAEEAISREHTMWLASRTGRRPIM